MKKGTEAFEKLTNELEKANSRNDELRRSVASYKSANTVLRRKLEKLGKLNAEADELYDKKAMECEQLKKELSETRALACKTQGVPVTTRVAELEQKLESKNSLIESLKESNQNLLISKKELEGKVESMTQEQVELYDTIEELRKPWWKRIF